MSKQIKHPPSSGPLEQRIRLASGLVLFSFALMHFLNHTLGNISLAAMDWGMDLFAIVWLSTPGAWLLYIAMFTHVALALWKTVRRRTWRMSGWEAVQLCLGLLIPYVLIKHIIVTRGATMQFGSAIGYKYELFSLWPGNALLQSGLLVIVWLHGCIGLHYWLRMKPWYARTRTTLACLALLIPVLALTGWISEARRVILTGEGYTAAEIASYTGKTTGLAFLTVEQKAALAQQVGIAQKGFYLFAAALFVFMIARHVYAAFARKITIQYLDGRTVKSAPGPTLLEISRMKGIPHMSVCGGRGRCSTCRTLILAGQTNLAPPNPVERQVLKRIDARSNVRLACQCRPVDDMIIRPLFNASKTISREGIYDKYRWGVEQQIAVMFIDLRGFTSLSEGKLPFDVVFILNRYVDGVVRTVQKAGGMVDKVMGDGVMVLFGVNTSLPEGVTSALSAIVALNAELSQVNEDLKSHLDKPLRIAVGMHAGTVILGRIGLEGRGGVASGLTALGDVVNVASRLEGVAKEENVVAAISHDVFDATGFWPDKPGSTRLVTVRGRQAPLAVACIANIQDLALPIKVPVSKSA